MSSWNRLSFFANIRPSNVQKEFSFFAFLCVFSSLMMNCRNFVRSSVIKMLSLLFLRFFFFDLRILITPLISSNSSWQVDYYQYCINLGKNKSKRVIITIFLKIITKTRMSLCKRKCKNNPRTYPNLKKSSSSSYIYLWNQCVRFPPLERCIW